MLKKPVFTCLSDSKFGTIIIGDNVEDKLQKLLEKISFDKDKHSYFEASKLDKIVGNKDKTEYTFFVSTEEIIPAHIFDELLKNLSETFKCEKAIIMFKPKNVDNARVQEYFTYLMGRYGEKCPAILTMVDSEVQIKEETLIIPVNNSSEENKINSLDKKIIADFKSFGYRLSRVNPIIKDEPEVFIEEEKEIEVDLEKAKQMTEQPKRRFTPKPIETEDHPEVVLGRTIDTDVVSLESLTGTANGVTLEGELFGIEFRSTKTDLIIMTAKITDYSDSIYAKLFINDRETKERLEKNLKVGSWYKFRGNIKEDKFSNEEVLTLHDINIAHRDTKEIFDDAEEKRVELHAHTHMSQMDGVVDVKKLLKTARKWGHKAIAITDHNCCQSFPDAHKFMKYEVKDNDFKVIYGVELVMIDDSLTIVTRPTKESLLDTTYVVFDTETTGFNAGGADQMIEIGAVKICNGEITDTFIELINPNKKLPKKITEITGITDAMLKGQRSEEEVTKSFMKWVGDLPLVAHNAKFDMSFLEMAFKKYKMGTIQNPIIDTLELSRTLDNTYSRHGLSAIVKRYEIDFDEEGHHRADYDSKATALVFHKMLKKLEDRNFNTIEDINKLADKNEIHKYGRGYHINILALNKIGLKNLFKIVSYANTKYLYKTPRILRSEIENLREGLLIGSGCYESEVFREAASKDDEELTNIINFYDYVEVQPPSVYDHMLQTSEFETKEELQNHITKIIRNTKEAGKIIIATGDVHHLYSDNRMYREIIVNQKVPGGGRHPLAKTNITKIPEQHLRTTKEMLEDFSFLNSELAHEIVIENTNIIADMVDVIDIIIDTGGVPFSPKIKDSAKIVREMVDSKCREIYGDDAPTIIKERIESEFNGIVKGGYDVIYLISHKLVKKSNDDGYLVGSRGSVGSSFLAYLMGITEVNALAAHYFCE